MLFTKTPQKSDSGAIARHLLNGAAIAQFAGVMLAEIADMADEEQLRGFFVAVGRRLAALHTTGEIKHLDALVAQMNDVWEMLDWGHATLELDDEGIDIFHSGMAETLEGDVGGIWAKIAPAVLEGAYDAWFRQMGSNGKLHTRVLRQVEGRIELRHGL